MAPQLRQSRLVFLFGLIFIIATVYLLSTSLVDFSREIEQPQSTVNLDIRIRNRQPHHSKEKSTTSTSGSKYDQYLISPSPCLGASSPFLLLFIFTRPDSFERRRTIRETYGSQLDPQGAGNCSSTIRLFFIIGKVGDRDLQKKLEDEGRLRGDIVQSEAFVDSYGQATRKGLAAIHWSLKYCPNAHFTAKADDDCWINLPRYLEILRKNRDEEKVIGEFWPNGAKVIRDPSNKWAVAESDFAPSQFPPYVSGILYAFHRNILARIALASDNLKYLWHDDVFLTGMAPQLAGVSHFGISGFDLTGQKWNSKCAKQKFLVIHYVDDRKMRILHNDTCHRYTLDC